QPGLVARTLLQNAGVAVASPGYLAQHGTPRTRRDIRKHRCILGFARGEVPQTHWPLADGGTVHIDGFFYSNDMPMLVEAARAGLGVAMVPHMSAQQYLESGELVEVLKGVLAGDSRISVVYAEREFLPPQVRAFVDAVMAWAPAAFARCRK